MVTSVVDVPQRKHEKPHQQRVKAVSQNIAQTYKVIQSRPTLYPVCLKPCIS